MSYKNQPLRSRADLGLRIAETRKAHRLTATALSAKAGRSRDILHRLERGDDVSVSSLLDILRAMGYQLELVPARPPTLDEVQARFADDD